MLKELLDSRSHVSSMRMITKEGLVKLILLALFFCTGCASKKIIMKNCEVVGDSKYHLCNELGLFE